MSSAPPPHLSPLYLIVVSPPLSPSFILLVVIVLICDSPAVAFAVHANHQRFYLPAVALTTRAGDSPAIALAALALCQRHKLLAVALVARAGNSPAVLLSPAQQLTRCHPCRPVTLPPLPSPGYNNNYEQHIDEGCANGGSHSNSCFSCIGRICQF